MAANMVPSRVPVLSYAPTCQHSFAILYLKPVLVYCFVLCVLHCVCCTAWALQVQKVKVNGDKIKEIVVSTRAVREVQLLLGGPPICPSSPIKLSNFLFTYDICMILNV